MSLHANNQTARTRALLLKPQHTLSESTGVGPVYRLGGTTHYWRLMDLIRWGIKYSARLGWRYFSIMIFTLWQLSIRVSGCQLLQTEPEFMDYYWFRCLVTWEEEWNWTHPTPKRSFNSIIFCRGKFRNAWLAFHHFWFPSLLQTSNLITRILICSKAEICPCFPPVIQFSI